MKNEKISWKICLDSIKIPVKKQSEVKKFQKRNPSFLLREGYLGLQQVSRCFLYPNKSHVSLHHLITRSKVPKIELIFLKLKARLRFMRHCTVMRISHCKFYYNHKWCVMIIIFRNSKNNRRYRKLSLIHGTGGWGRCSRDHWHFLAPHKQWTISLILITTFSMFANS